MSKFLSFLAAVIYMWYIANGEELHNLKELQWRDSHVAEFECPDGHDYCAEMEFCSKGPILGYRTEMGGECSTPGPVIRVKPGYRYHLTLRNAVGSPTNIHTHGMFISGSGNGDDVTRSASPGQCLHYSWIVPESHMGGTHWYVIETVSKRYQIGCHLLLGKCAVCVNLPSNIQVPLTCAR